MQLRKIVSTKKVEEPEVPIAVEEKIENESTSEIKSDQVQEQSRYEYVTAGANIASVIEDMYHNIYNDLAPKTDNPHELTIQLLQAGFSTAMASINIKANYSKVTVHKIGFSSGY